MIYDWSILGGVAIFPPLPESVLRGAMGVPTGAQVRLAFATEPTMNKIDQDK